MKRMNDDNDNGNNSNKKDKDKNNNIVINTAFMHYPKRGCLNF